MATTFYFVVIQPTAVKSEISAQLAISSDDILEKLLSCQLSHQ